MNEYLKAFNDLKKTIWKLSNDKPKKKDCESLFLIHDLVMKQAPHHIELEADGYDDSGNLIYDTAYCPNCHKEFEVDYDEHCNYCPNCGQRLDWSMATFEYYEESEE